MTSWALERSQCATLMTDWRPPIQRTAHADEKIFVRFDFKRKIGKNDKTSYPIFQENTFNTMNIFVK
jgi:hypothetical protein